MVIERLDNEFTMRGVTGAMPRHRCEKKTNIHIKINVAVELFFMKTIYVIKVCGQIVFKSK